MIDCPGCGRPIKSTRSIGAHSMWFPDCTHEKRFWGRVQKGEEGCWLWTGPKNEWGYGLTAVPGNQNMRCHRYAWELKNGPIPADKILMHTCDTPACVNPGHLRLGTFKENSDDMIAKGRHNNQYVPIEKLRFPHCNQRGKRKGLRAKQRASRVPQTQADKP